MGHFSFSARLCCGHGCDGIKEVKLVIVKAAGVAYLLGDYVICGIPHKAYSPSSWRPSTTQVNQPNSGIDKVLDYHKSCKI